MLKAHRRMPARRAGEVLIRQVIRRVLEFVGGRISRDRPDLIAAVTGERDCKIAAPRETGDENPGGVDAVTGFEILEHVVEERQIVACVGVVPSDAILLVTDPIGKYEDSACRRARGALQSP